MGRIKTPERQRRKFRYKNGGSETSRHSQSSANILYAKSKEQKRKEEEKAQYKNKLLDILGDKATPADILYGDTEKLERKIQQQGTMTGGASGIQASSSTNGKFQKPVNAIIKSNYGPRKPPTPNSSDFHSGIDFKVPIGTPVKTIGTGVVTRAGKVKGYGNAVYIDHGIINGKRVTSELGHLSECNVKVGDKVAPGQVVAKSGNTGDSTGPHLHLTIRENGKAVNPAKYLKY